MKSSRDPSEMIRKEALRGLRIVEDVRLVRALVDGRAAELGEPDRLRSRLPGGRRRRLDAADPIDMRVGPPADQVLVAKDPVLAVGAVGDRQALLRVATRGIGVVPVEALAARDVRLQVVEAVDRSRHGIRVAGAVAPVRERHVVVDADEVDRRRGPERIEVVEHVPRSVGRLVPEILRPVGRIADPGSRQDRREPPRPARRAPAPPGSRRPNRGSASGPASPIRCRRHPRRRPAAQRCA